jgi:arsenate reductase
MDKTRVLFLCTGNSARSQMSEAFLRRLGGDRFEVYSAGLDLAPRVNPLAIRAMAELGYDLSAHYVKHLDTYAGKIEFDYLITVCGHAEETCPFFPGMGQRLHWPFDDPAAFEGGDEAKMAKFREVRDQIRARIEAWLAQGAQGGETMTFSLTPGE